MVLVVGPCDCIARIYDEALGRAEYLAYYQAWVWHSTPLRSTTWRSKSQSGGEPYLYHACPHCGGRLPNIHYDDESGDDRPPFGQADGADD